MIVLRDAQEQRVARLDAERKLAEFQEQLKKVFHCQYDPGGLAFNQLQMTQAFQYSLFGFVPGGRVSRVCIYMGLFRHCIFVTSK